MRTPAKKLNAFDNWTRKQLRLLGKAINSSIAYPNSGGCGIIAHIVGQHLESLGYSVDIVTLVGPYNRPACDARAEVTDPADNRQWGMNGLSRHHLAVRVKMSGRLYTWDSDILLRSGKIFGKCFYPTHPKFGSGLTVAEVREMCKDARSWNDTFNRAQIPEIENLASHYLKET